MKSIFLTGGSGFVGSNLVKYLSTNFQFIQFKKGDAIEINQEYVIHLAGKAHDLKKTTNPGEYYQVNTELTKKVFDKFLTSNAKVFITLSSTKAVADEINEELSEEIIPKPITHYGKSKLLAEQYIFSKELSTNKRVYILRPCMIYGLGNKGNLKLLFKIVSKGIPWPLGAFENQRSFCSIENLMFVIRELIENENIPSGIYNMADDEPLSTNMLISLIAQAQDKSPVIWKIPKHIIQKFAQIGDFLGLPLTTERLHKLTDSYIVSNKKIKSVINKPLPLSSREGLLKSFKSFN